MQVMLVDLVHQQLIKEAVEAALILQVAGALEDF